MDFFRNRSRLLLTAMLLVVGIYLATRLVNAGGSIIAQVQKVTAIMSLIEQAYVEEPDLDRLSEGAISGMLERLDPHSVYIPAKEQKDLAERDAGEFSGIGVSFILQNELITVVTPIAGSPSDRLGIRAGDRIIEIDGVSAFGIKEDEVFKKLRGPKGTTVNLKIAREGVNEPLEFAVVREAIPIHSILTSFMLDDSTGYLLLNQFTATTSDELETTLRRLERLGMKRLLFDLRNNGGGRLNEAVQVVDMFVPGGYTIVSRHGRNDDDDSTYTSKDEGTHPFYNVIVLMNGGSASASEIVAGAMQDLDRGLIVGQRSFGKGLVQNSYPLKDGSMIRLSTAHWYAPSGRMVQIPYDKGRGEYYAVRYRNQGVEAVEKDRVPFKTLSGRTVFGTSGIIPDSTVEDLKITNGTAQVIGAQIVFAFARDLARESKLTEKNDFREFLLGFSVTDADLDKLPALALAKKITYPVEALARDREYLRMLIKAEIAQYIWNDRDAYYSVLMQTDPVVSIARTLFPEAGKIASRWQK